MSQRRRTPVRRALPLAIISIILRAIVDPSHHLHHGRLQTASLSPVIARDDERAPTGRVGRLSPDGMSSYLLRSPRPLRNARSRWLPRRLNRFILNRSQQFQSRPRQRTARQARARQQAVARPRVTARQRATAQSQATTQPQITARPQATARSQGTARLQATAQPQGTAWQQGTARQQVTALSQWTARPQLWIQTLTTQQMSRCWSHHIVHSYVLMTQTIRMVQHLFQQREWTDRQGRRIRQPRQWVDQTFPSWRGPALHLSSLPFRRPSIRQHWWILCRCGRCFNAAWNCLVFQTTPSVRLSSHLYLFLNMTQPTRDQPRLLDLQQETSLQRGSSIRLRVLSVVSSDRPRRPRDRPELPWDLPECPWEDLGTTASPGIQDHAPHSPDPRQWSPRDESPLNFNAALDMDSKRALSKDEDAEGDSKKISAAQYEIFRQAVTSSKGTYKINPAKTKRAARASLLNLGDTEVPDRVSWLDQPSLQDTMASTARIAQGLKEDKEVVKMTLLETLNDNTWSFKFFTVKQIFPREPYRLKVHRDALYAPKPPGDHGFIDNKTPSSYHLSHRVCLDTEELARRSAIYASLADSMVASVIEELSPKDKRSKLLREKLTIIQEAQVSAVSVGFAAVSNLQLLRHDALLRNFNFQPPVLSAVRTALFEGHHVVGPEPKALQARVRAIRQADRMTGSSVTFAKQKEVKTSTKMSSKKTAPRPSVFDRLGSPPSTTQRTVTQESPFRAGAGRARPWPFQGSKKSSKSSSSSAAKKRWRVTGGGWPGRLCPALAESAGQLPGHRHRRGRGGHCIPATTSAHPSKHQFPDQEQPTRPSASRRCLADGGSHRACHQREVPGFLQSVVSGTQEDSRSATCDRPVHSQPSHGGSTLQDGDARVRPISHQKSGVGGVHRHTRCLSSCADASSCPQVSAFRGQQEGVPVHLSSVWTGNFSTGVHQAAETRRLAVEAASFEATRLLRRLADQGRYTGRSSTACPDNHQGPPVSWMDQQLREVRPHSKSRLPVHRDAVQHSTFHSGAPAENASKGPVSSSTLDGQSEHNCQRSAQTSRHAGVHGLAGPARTAPSSSSPIVGGYSMVPEDRELVRPDSSSTVGSVRGGMVVIPSSPARSTPRHQGDGSNSLHRCVQFGLGSPVRLTLDTGTVVSISKIVPHKRSRDAGCHLCCERLPTSSEVPSGVTDVRQRSDGGVGPMLWL